MTRQLATNRIPFGFGTSNKTILDTFAADGWTKSGSGSPLGTWSVDNADKYNGRNTLKLITTGTGSTVRDNASKSISHTLDMSRHNVFELIVKVNDINGIARFYLDIYCGSSYYEIMLESTGNKWGFNNEYETFRGTLHQNLNSLKYWRGDITQIRLQCSDNGKPITFNFAELSVYEMTKRAYIVFTNDDGNKSAYDFQQNVMKPLGITGSFFPSRENVTSGQGGDANYMNHSNLLQMEADGCEIGIHGGSGISKAASTISFEASTSKILDSGEGFADAGFVVGQIIYVTNSTKNNGKYNVVAVEAGYIQVAETLVDEAAGSSKTIAAQGFASYTPSTFAAYIDGQIDYFKETAGVGSAMDTCAYPDGEYGKDSDSFPYTNVKSRTRLARVTHDNFTECLIPSDYWRIHAGKKMYMRDGNTVQIMKDSISNLVFTGGIGVIVSHNIKEEASSATNYNLTDATAVINFIKTLKDAGLVEVINLGDIDKISPAREAATQRTAIDHMGNWDIKSIDLMHQTKDTMRSQVSEANMATITAAVKDMGATHAGVSFPLDEYDEYEAPQPSSGYGLKWLNAIRAAGLKVYWRNTWLNFDGIYDSAKITPTSTPSIALGTAAGVLTGTDTSSYLYKCYNFIKTHSSWFASGDAWGVMPEPENQSIRGETNLVANPNFETNTTGWYLDAEFTRSDEDSQTGDYSIKQVSASGYTSMISGEITVTPETEYTLEFYSKITVNSGNPPKLQLNKTASTEGEIEIQDITASADWAKTTVTFTTEAGQTKLWVRILNYDGSVTAFYDSFSLEGPLDTTKMFDTYAELGQFLVDLKTVSDAAFAEMGVTGVITGMTSINGGTILNDYIGNEYWEQVGRCVIDHYVNTSLYASQLDTIHANANVPIYIGEFGVTSSVANVMTDDVRSWAINNVFYVLKAKSYIDGVNYWQAAGADATNTESILDPTTFVANKGAEVVKRYFTGNR